MESWKLNFEKISAKSKEEGKDLIPSNWYIPAQKAWEVFAWALGMRHVMSLYPDKEIDSFIHQYWEYIENHAITFDEENQGGKREDVLEEKRA